MDQAAANRQKVRDAYDTMARGDEEGFYAIFAPDATLWEAESLPYGGTYKGLEALRHGVSRMFAAWDDMRFTVEEITAGGDLVIVYLNTSATGRATGKTYAFPVAEVWRFRDGKAIELRPFYWDTHRAIEVFGG